MTRWLFVLFVAVPLAEILLLIEIGKQVGLLPTVALVLSTAVVGVALLKRQGLAVLAQARASLDRGEMPMDSVVDGACLLVAGAFLLTPGLITDTAGFLLLVPTVRRWLAARLLAFAKRSGKVEIHGFDPFSEPSRRHNDESGPVIETDYHEIHPGREKPSEHDERPANSPWRRRP
ncbi:MAG: FxsA family protein [Pseudomonadota bacterium]|nr:FxsA family protein [Pseudomonadota bacterium]